MGDFETERRKRKGVRGPTRALSTRPLQVKKEKRKKEKEKELEKEKEKELPIIYLFLSWPLRRENGKVKGTKGKGKGKGNRSRLVGFKPRLRIADFSQRTYELTSLSIKAGFEIYLYNNNIFT